MAENGVEIHNKKNKYYGEKTKRIFLIGVVTLTFILLVVSVIHDICTEDVPIDDTENVFAESSGVMSGEDDLSKASGAENSTDGAVSSDESLDTSEISEEESFEESSEEVSEEGFMAGAVHDVIDGLYLSSPYCFVYDATDNTILYEKNAYDKCYPASVTKLLTAAVALEYVPADTPFVVGTEITMVGPNSSMAYIDEGTSFTLNDLLYALLLPSGNDAAYTIAVNTARYLYGDALSDVEAVEKFMELCNKKLLEIGAYNTHFSGPDGYHRDDHYTTAYDMTLISLYSTSFEEISVACGTYEYYCKSLEGIAKGWRNTNPLIKKNGQYYSPYATGLKTGSTTEAGKCLATMAEKDGKKIYIVVLGSLTVDVRNNDTLSVIHTVLGY